MIEIRKTVNVTDQVVGSVNRNQSAVNRPPGQFLHKVVGEIQVGQFYQITQHRDVFYCVVGNIQLGKMSAVL